MNVKLLQKEALLAGFDSSFLADILQKFGPDVLNAVVEAVKHGFSVNTVVELLQKVGPTLFLFIVNYLTKAKADPVLHALHTS